MTRRYDFSNLDFREFKMPPDIDENTPSDVIRALRIYSQIEPERFDTTTIDGQYETIDQFAGQRAYVTREIRSSVIQAVANYHLPSRPETDFAFIEGIAVHPRARSIGMGVFMILKLGDVARLDGRNALELNAKQGVEPFYEKLGFQYIHESSSGSRMRRDLDS